LPSTGTMAMSMRPISSSCMRALIEKGIETPFFRDAINVLEKTSAEFEMQLSKTRWLACDMYSLADAEIAPYIERADRLGLAGLGGSRPRLADWFARVKARPSYNGITDDPPTETNFDDTGRDGLEDCRRIAQMIVA
jgi:glutathione S-transferase